MIIAGVVTLLAGNGLSPYRIITTEAARASQDLDSNGQEISDSARQQIEALIEEKALRSPAQRKINSQLLYAEKMARGEAIAGTVQTLAVNVPTDSDGRLVVDITAAVSNSLLERLKGTGADIIVSVPQFRSVRAEVSLNQIETIAGFPEVQFIQPKMEGMTNQVQATRPSARDDGASFAERAARVQAQFANLVDGNAQNVPIANVGTRTSEGDTTHKAKDARAAFGFNGSGIKIGVLSDGVTTLGGAQRSGDLGQVTVLPGQAGSGDEGTAMLEIVHDLAPGAQLYFATAFSGAASFAQNILALRAAGCDIIVDDVFYTGESPFQDGQAANVNSNIGGAVITQAVNDVTASGALYFSSAGNSGNKNDGTSGVWEGDFVDGGPLAVVPGAGTVHDFDPTAAVAQSNSVTVIGILQYNLFWSDPLGGSTNDYDLFALNAAGTAVVASSTDIQNGTQDPFEFFAPSAVGTRLVIRKANGAAVRFLHLVTNRGRLTFNTDGCIQGHSMAASAYSVAATPAALTGGTNPNGPFPGFFTAANNQVESYSSDGPRRIFFQPNGTPYTPGNFSATGGVLRQKPDITAADGVSVTGADNFTAFFYGTSAAAPHAAAIAGLLKSSNPSLTANQIRTALTSTAIDIEAAGVDRDAGAGIVMALESMQSLGLVAGAANLEVGTVASTELTGNGNATVEPGETGQLTIQLRNLGTVAATGVNATLTSLTSGVNVNPPGTSAYPNIAAAGNANNTTPFVFSVSSTAACATQIQFRLTVTYAGGPSPRIFDFTVETGQQAVISAVLDVTVSPNGPNYTATTGTLTNRLSRNALVNFCDNTKVNPGLAAATNPRYDAYRFTNTSAQSICVNVNLAYDASPITQNQLQVVAYVPSLVPANPGTNYAGDAGSSVDVQDFSFKAGPGDTFDVVVNDPQPGNPSTGLGQAYTLRVSGLPCTAATLVNQPPVNTVPAAQSVVQNSQLFFSTVNGNAISIADPDAGSNPVKVTLTATNGTLFMSNVDLSFSVGSGFDNSTMTFTGTIAAINSAMQGLTYRPNFGFTGAASLTITTNDQGFLGSGGAKSDTDVVAINVTSGSAFKFDSATYLVGESDGQLVFTVLREGDNSAAASVQFGTSNATASDRSDYGAAYGTLNFAPGQFSATFPVLINEDSLVEGTEVFFVTLFNPQGTNVALGLQPTALGIIVDNNTEPATNVIDDSNAFVRQHYHDFLNREADPAGLAFWVNNIESCGANPSCREVKRVDTSAAFFLSTEFQQTGYFVYRSYTAAFGTNRIGATVPLTLLEFLPDTQQIGRGVVIGNAGADAQLETNKKAYLLQFVQRTAFTTLYPPATTPAAFVDALNTNTGNSLTVAERNALVAQLTANNTTQGRADVLRAVVDNAAFQAKEFNRAFVLMEYFGYMRRNPNDAPDTNFSGYTFWLNKLNAFNGDFRAADMVKAFITSAEYRKRFGLN